MGEPLIPVTIERSRWHRGQGSVGSALLRVETQKMCCLGFASLACGYSKEAITSVATPLGTTANVDRWPIGTFMAEESSVSVNGMTESRTISLMMRINDRPVNDYFYDDSGAQVWVQSEEWREAELTKLARKVGFEFTFVD